MRIIKEVHGWLRMLWGETWGNKENLKCTPSPNDAMHTKQKSGIPDVLYWIFLVTSEVFVLVDLYLSGWW